MWPLICRLFGRAVPAGRPVAPEGPKYTTQSAAFGTDDHRLNILSLPPEVHILIEEDALPLDPLQPRNEHHRKRVGSTDPSFSPASVIICETSEISRCLLQSKISSFMADDEFLAFFWG
ncbi:hypothetical protein VTN96DRAFT_4408 [Rasamsonia emersonii]